MTMLTHRTILLAMLLVPALLQGCVAFSSVDPLESPPPDNNGTVNNGGNNGNNNNSTNNDPNNNRALTADCKNLCAFLEEECGAFDYPSNTNYPAPLAGLTELDCVSSCEVNRLANTCRQDWTGTRDENDCEEAYQCVGYQPCADFCMLIDKCSTHISPNYSAATCNADCADWPSNAIRTACDPVTDQHDTPTCDHLMSCGREALCQEVCAFAAEVDTILASDEAIERCVESCDGPLNKFTPTYDCLGTALRADDPDAERDRCLRPMNDADQQAQCSAACDNYAVACDNTTAAACRTACGVDSITAQAIFCAAHATDPDDIDTCFAGTLLDDCAR